MAPASHDNLSAFSSALRMVGGECRTVEGGFAVAEAIEEIVREAGGPAALLYEPFPEIERLGIPLALKARGIRMVPVESGKDVPELRVGLTAAALGVAESGSLLVGGRPGGWGLATVLPWAHIALLRSDDICPDIATAFGRLRERFEAGEREWVWITGPSKTADIAKTLVTGIHGPNSVHALVLTGDAEADR